MGTRQVDRPGQGQADRIDPKIWCMIRGTVRRDGRVALPPKVRELISNLSSAGFVDRGGKGSHRNFVHPNVTKPVVISGNPGDDAKHYQIRAVQLAIKESKA